MEGNNTDKKPFAFTPEQARLLAALANRSLPAATPSHSGGFNSLSHNPPIARTYANLQSSHSLQSGFSAGLAGQLGNSVFGLPNHMVKQEAHETNGEGAYSIWNQHRQEIAQSTVTLNDDLLAMHHQAYSQGPLSAATPGLASPVLPVSDLVTANKTHPGNEQTIGKEYSHVQAGEVAGSAFGDDAIPLVTQSMGLANGTESPKMQSDGTSSSSSSIPGGGLSAQKKIVKQDSANTRVWQEEIAENERFSTEHLKERDGEGGTIQHTLRCSVCHELGIDLAAVRVPKKSAMVSRAGSAVKRGTSSLFDPEGIKDSNALFLTNLQGAGGAATAHPGAVASSIKPDSALYEAHESDDSGSEIEENCGYAKRFFRLQHNDVTRCGVVSCGRCRAAVHTVCYGLASLAPGASFTCTRCSQGLESVQCELCPNRGGIFKATDEGLWVHVACALWVPRVLFADWQDDAPGAATMEMREPITLQYIEEARWRLKCKVCSKRRGATARKSLKKGKSCCIQCNAGKCATAFHVTCAQESLPLFVRWDLFPSATSVEGYCMENHVPGHYRKKRQDDSERAKKLRTGSKVMARYQGDGLWYAGTVQYVSQRKVCRVQLTEDAFARYDIKAQDLARVGTDADDSTEIATGDLVKVLAAKGSKQPLAGAEGKVASIDEYDFYRVIFEDGYTTTCRRADICTEPEWVEKQQAGAKEGHALSAKSSDSDVDNSEINLGFIIPRKKRLSSMTAEVANKEILVAPQPVRSAEPDPDFVPDPDDLVPLLLKRPTSEVESQRPDSDEQTQAIGKKMKITPNIQAQADGSVKVRHTGEKEEQGLAGTPRGGAVKLPEKGQLKQRIATQQALGQSGVAAVNRTASPAESHMDRSRSDEAVVKVKATRQCGGDKCTNSLARGSAYCSYHCAVKTTESIFKLWVANRKYHKRQAGNS